MRYGGVFMMIPKKRKQFILSKYRLTLDHEIEILVDGDWEPVSPEFKFIEEVRSVLEEEKQIELDWLYDEIPEYLKPDPKVDVKRYYFTLGKSTSAYFFPSELRRAHLGIEEFDMQYLRFHFKMVDGDLFFKSGPRWIHFEFENHRQLQQSSIIYGTNWSIQDLAWSLHHNFILPTGWSVKSLSKSKSSLKKEDLVARSEKGFASEITKIDDKFIIQIKVLEWFYLASIEKTEDEAKKRLNGFNETKECYENFYDLQLKRW